MECDCAIGNIITLRVEVELKMCCQYVPAKYRSEGDADESGLVVY